MIKRVFKLFQIARKLALSGAVENINDFHRLPTTLNLFFSLISIGSQPKHIEVKKKAVKKFVTLYKAWEQRS